MSDKNQIKKMQNPGIDHSSQPLELFFYLTKPPKTHQTVLIEVAEVEWDQVATTASLLQAPVGSLLPRGGKVKSDFSNFVKAGSDKVLGQTEALSTTSSKLRFGSTVTIPYIFEKKQILKISVKDGSTN